MNRHHDPTDRLDPAAVADLAELEAALAGEATDAGWAALVVAVRDEAPAPATGFARALDDRVAAGFPRARPAWLRLPARAMLPALAVACSLLVGGVVVGTGALDGTGSTPDQTGGDAAMSAPSSGEASSGASGGAASSAETAPAPPTAGAASQRDLAGRGPAPAAVPPAAPGSPPLGSAPGPVAREVERTATLGGAPGPVARKVERTATLGLTTDAKGLQDAANGLVRATQDLGGVVASSQVDSTPSGGDATFVLRIPTARVDDALKRFAELAGVARLSEGAQDITGSFVSAQDRLSDARAERKALLAALGKASTPRSIASLRARIRGNRTEIARLEGDLRGLRRRADFTRVDVSVRARGAAEDPDAGSAWGPGDAARDALRVLEVLAGVALVAGAVLLPLALLGWGAALAGRGLRRRRREAALGGG